MKHLSIPFICIFAVTSCDQQEVDLETLDVDRTETIEEWYSTSINFPHPPTHSARSMGTWTQWYDRDNPSGNGDYESVHLQPGVCPTPTGVECRTTSDLPLWQTGENVTCSTSTVRCVNAQQPDFKCDYDYKVRFLCDDCTLVDVVPPMTSNNTPQGIVTTSGDFNGSYPGWHAFDADDPTLWISEVWQSPAWIAYDFQGASATVNEYEIVFKNGQQLTSRAPNTWEFQGWDGNNWVVLDQRAGESNWAGSETRRYAVANPGSYSKYRLHVTEDNDPRSAIVVISIGRLRLLGC